MNKPVIDFSDIKEVQKLLGGTSPAMQQMHNTTAELVRSFRQAEEAVIIAFAGQNGIELPTDCFGIARRQRLMKQMELLCATGASPFVPGESRIIQESWCVDRRNGKTGFERTYPRCQLVQEPDGTTFKVVIVNDPDQEKTDGIKEE